MSNNGWKPRKTETITCPSGQTVQVRRPGPEFMLRAGRVAKTFSNIVGRKGEDESAEDYSLNMLAKMSDDELAAVMIFARELVCEMLVSPRLVREPRGPDEIGPDDIGDDFWFLFNYAMTGYFNLKIPVGDGEVEVADVESFPEVTSVSGDGPNGESISPASEFSA